MTIRTATSSDTASSSNGGEMEAGAEVAAAAAALALSATSAGHKPRKLSSFFSLHGLMSVVQG